MNPLNHELHHTRLMWALVVTMAIAAVVLITSVEIPGWGLLALFLACPLLVLLLMVAVDGGDAADRPPRRHRGTPLASG